MALPEIRPPSSDDDEVTLRSSPPQPNTFAPATMVAWAGSTLEAERARMQRASTALVHDFGKHQLTLSDEDRTDMRDIVCGGETVSLGMVADGHGGREAAEHCAAHVLCYVAEAANGDGSASSLRKACKTAFERAHRELLAAGIEAGCTLTVVALNLSRSEVCHPPAPSAAAASPPRCP